ncbi:11722_t:CDS:2, partial [Gigaspora margarita]
NDTYGKLFDKNESWARKVTINNYHRSLLHLGFTFDHVEYLEITNNNSENYKNLLTSFDFPDVKTLKLDFLYCVYGLTSQPSLNQVHRKHPKLKRGFIINNGSSLEGKQVYYYKTYVSSLKDAEMKIVIEIVNSKFSSNVQISKDSPNKKMLVELWS